jgi:antitoxin FitA
MIVDWRAAMASITIRNIDDDVKKALRLQAASNGRSMENEARTILATAVRATPAAFGQQSETMAEVLKEIRKIVDDVGGFDIVVGKEPPTDFSEYVEKTAKKPPGMPGKAA